jgi:hypothetical protein
MADALAQGVAERERLATSAGGLFSACTFAQALCAGSVREVERRRMAHQVLAVRVADGWRYPVAQIAPDGQIPPLLPAILCDGMA